TPGGTYLGAAWTTRPSGRGRRCGGETALPSSASARSSRGVRDSVICGCSTGSSFTSSADDLLNRLAVVDLQPFLAGHVERAVVEAELVQHGGVDVGDVMAVCDRMEADLVGGAVGQAALNSAAGQPDREAVRGMVAAGRPFRAGRAAKLPPPA